MYNLISSVEVKTTICTSKHDTCNVNWCDLHKLHNHNYGAYPVAEPWYESLPSGGDFKRPCFQDQMGKGGDKGKGDKGGESKGVAR